MLKNSLFIGIIIVIIGIVMLASGENRRKKGELSVANLNYYISGFGLILLGIYKITTYLL